MIFLEIEGWNLRGRGFEIPYRPGGKGSYRAVFLYAFKVDELVKCVRRQNTLKPFVNNPFDFVGMSYFQWKSLLKYS